MLIQSYMRKGESMGNTKVLEKQIISLFADPITGQ